MKGGVVRCQELDDADIRDVMPCASYLITTASSTMSMRLST